MVPVVLLTGFLGSGKTTLLNQLMAEKPESAGQLALIVNEFGDVGIDGDLLPQDLTKQVELPGGCICCALDEDLEKTLHQLLDDNPTIKTIVVETTGIAEPLPISWTLAKEELACRVRLAAVITIVDPLEHMNHRSESPSVDGQVKYADLLVVSKLDLEESQGSLTTLLEHLREQNEFASIIAEPPDKLPQLLWATLAEPEDYVAPGEAARVASKSQAAHDHRHENVHGIQSISMPIAATLDLEELTASLEELPANYLRIKGIARVIDGSTGSREAMWVAFHRVGPRVSAEPLSVAGEARIVALGKDLEASAIATCIESAVLG